MGDTPTMVVTGTSRGIGRYLVKYYAKRGYHVVGCSRTDLAEPIENYTHYVLDVSDEAQVRGMFVDIRRRFKRLDCLINNAGVASMNHSLLTPMRTVEKVMSTNVFGTFLCTREAAKLMQMRKFGRVVNFASVAVPLRLEGEAIYAASKAAVISLTQILAKEFGGVGITVNAIGPTPIRTDLIRGVPEEKLQELINRQAIKRYGTFEDVANIADFLLKPQSGFVTGQVFFLGGIS